MNVNPAFAFATFVAVLVIGGLWIAIAKLRDRVTRERMRGPRGD